MEENETEEMQAEKQLEEIQTEQYSIEEIQHKRNTDRKTAGRNADRTI